MMENEQVAWRVGCSTCAEERGKDVAFGKSGLKRGGFERVSLIHLQFVADSMRPSGAYDSLFLTLERI